MMNLFFHLLIVCEKNNAIFRTLQYYDKTPDNAREFGSSALFFRFDRNKLQLLSIILSRTESFERVGRQYKTVFSGSFRHSIFGRLIEKILISSVSYKHQQWLQYKNKYKRQDQRYCKQYCRRCQSQPSQFYCPLFKNRNIAIVHCGHHRTAYYKYRQNN